MSSLLLLSAIGEGVASFVLPIIDAFGPPKYVEHKFYFEVGSKSFSLLQGLFYLLPHLSLPSFSLLPFAFDATEGDAGLM